MFIDLNDLTKKVLTKKEIDMNIPFDKIDDYEEGIEFEKPVHINVAFNCVENIIYMDGDLEAFLILTCSRCLEKFKQYVKLKISEKIFLEDILSEDETFDKEYPSDDFIILEGGQLNIDDIIKNNIVLALPYKKLCKDDCKGLCQICGANLNSQSCNCTGDNIDPRLVSLKDLFSGK